ncbi:MAG: amidohydrolase [Rhodospirillaceae bacterium]|nr:amidohydrolase [Rhodospirillaceae bacterium]
MTKLKWLGGAVAAVSMLALTSGAIAADAALMKKSAVSWLDANTKTLEAAHKKIWTYAEAGLEETKSSKELQDLLKANGFTVKAGVAGMPTAFVATYGEGGPVVGILAEFDALLGISQDDSSSPHVGANPESGHACGHSIFGAGSVGAAIAVKQLIASGDIKGTIKLYGTPAEETGIGKVYMLRDGYFKNDDAILHWHANDKNQVTYMASKAMINVKFNFKGVAAHASAQPFAGRSALDAVELMSVGVQYMREHIKQEARIHSVITKGGGQPNVVPAEAEAWYYVRANNFDDAFAYYNWVKDIAEAAAKMSKTELTVAVQSESHDILENRAMAVALQKNFAEIGVPQWTPAELAFAATTQKEFKDPFGFDFTKAGINLSSKLEPLPDQFLPASAGSTDVGDIAWNVPVAGIQVAAYGYGLPIHSWPVIAATGTSIGTKAMATASKVLAATAIDLMTDPALMAAAKADFKKVRDPLTWRSAIPDAQKAPKSVR